MKNMRITLLYILVAGLMVAGVHTQVVQANEPARILPEEQLFGDRQAQETPAVTVVVPDVDVTTTETESGGGISTTWLIIIIVAVLILLVGILLGTQRHVHHD